jgi:hypothetical protein
MGSSAIPFLAEQRVDRSIDSTGTPGSPKESKPLRNVPRRVSRGPQTLEQTLKQLAEREMWTDPDSLGESGVRHLKVEVQESTSGRSS